MCFRVRFIIKQVDVLILPKVIVTFVLSMSSIPFLSSVNDFVMLLLFVWFSSAPTCIVWNREYFMGSGGVRYLRTSCWRIRNRTSESSERVRFLIQKQRVRKYRTKHFPCGIVFIIYILRHSFFWRPLYFKSFKIAKICRYILTVCGPWSAQVPDALGPRLFRKR